MPNKYNGNAGTTHAEGAAAVKDAVSTHAAQATDTVRQQLGSAADQAKDKVFQAAETRKQDIVEQAHTAVDSVDKIATQLQEDGYERPADMLRSAADSVEQMLTSFETRDMDEILGNLKTQVARSPFTFAGVMFGLGFVATRLLSAEAPQASAAYNNGESELEAQNNPAPYAPAAPLQARIENDPTGVRAGAGMGAQGSIYRGGGQF